MKSNLFKISYVNPFILNGEQLVEFRVEKWPLKIFLSGESITEQTGIHITEVEVLIGSYINPTFYKIGETTKSKVICSEENTIIKSCTIIKSADNETMKITNIDKLLYFSRIRNIHEKEKNNNHKLHIIELNNLTTVPFFSLSRLIALIGLLPSEFYLLKGEFVSPVFYRKGELLEDDDQIVQKEKTIVKNLNLRITNTFANFRKYKTADN